MFSYGFLVGTVEIFTVDLVNGNIKFICPGLILMKISGGGIMGKAHCLHMVESLDSTSKMIMRVRQKSILYYCHLKVNLVAQR